MKNQHIRYGEYEQDKWHILKGVWDPNVQEFLDRIRELDWIPYQLWLYGGILQNRETGDIDGTIIGPRDPERINYLLDGITSISFELGVRHDIQWSQDIYDPNKDITKSCTYAHYKPYRWDDDQFIKYAEEVDGLYISHRTWPLNKTRGKTYPSPQRFI